MADGSSFAIAPMLAYRNTAEALAFYERAFGAVETLRLAEPGGSIVHAEMRIGTNAVFMLADENPQYNATPARLGGSAVVLNLVVDNVDMFVQRAELAGATVQSPPTDQFYGHRTARLTDPFGYVWLVGTLTEALTSSEIRARFERLMQP